MQNEMDEGTRKAIDKIEKLMRLAGSNPNEAEAASALAKAQELLTAYNLDMVVVEQNSGASGKRTDEMIAGGMHRYQRELWNHIARLNFCMYWTQKNFAKPGSLAAKRGRKITHEHRLVGRVTNVIATRNMAGYLEQTIERLCREMLGSENARQYYSRDAIAFREGVSDRVIEKIVDRRREIVAKEEREAAEAARRASEAGVSLATTLTVAGLSDKERDANTDFLFGEGTSARRREAAAKWDAEWEERRKAQAEATAAAEKEAAEWAAAHPEEAKKEAARERARERARARRDALGGSANRRYRFRQTSEEMRRSSGSYHAGYKKGEDISIDQQVKKEDARRIT